jgi:hypothetical protein
VSEVWQGHVGLRHFETLAFYKTLCQSKIFEMFNDLYAFSPPQSGE